MHYTANPLKDSVAAQVNLPESGLQLESILADIQAAAALPSVGWEIDLQSPGRTKVPRPTPASV